MKLIHCVIIKMETDDFASIIVVGRSSANCQSNCLIA